jgi:hypothetical protein
MSDGIVESDEICQDFKELFKEWQYTDATVKLDVKHYVNVFANLRLRDLC